MNDFEQFDDEEDAANYSANQTIGYGEEFEHEIEGVYFHIRDEGRENDNEDLWHDNVVSFRTFSWIYFCWCPSQLFCLL